MPRRGIKTSPRVKSGRQHTATRGPARSPLANHPRSHPAILRQHPGKDHRHVLMVRHIRQFIDLLPDWPELSRGLNTIVLAPAKDGCDGFHRPGLVALCAQPRSLQVEIDNPEYYSQHQSLFIRLGIATSPRPSGHLIRYTESQLRAYQLVHVFLHELGHHHDRMTTRRQRNAGRGEAYAERYANTYADQIWEAYLETFGAE